MMRSLRTKLILMTLVTGVAGVILAGLFVRFVTLREFDRLVLEQARINFESEVTAHYSEFGTLENFNVRRPSGRGPRNNNESGNNSSGAGNHDPRDNPPLERPPMFVLIDENGRALHDAGNINRGQRVPPDAIGNSPSLEIAGELIGYIALVGGPTQFTQQEVVYLERTNNALIAGAVGGAGLSVILGAVMAQYMLRPLRELTRALRRVNTEGPGAQLDVRTNDELGELTVSFNRMSEGLERANRLREQMTADIAHDLRTPLTVISGYLEGLRDGTLKPTPRRFDTMYSEAQYLTRLIEDLRTLSLADAGALTLNLESIAINDLLHQVAQAFEHTATDQQIMLFTDVDRSLPPLCIDNAQIRRVLSNLVSNALRYTPAEGRISLQAQRDGKYAHLIVADTGKGIAPEKLPDIFERFYRADSARNLNGYESGLGLAIAKSIVEAHNGKIYAESKPGEGTTIHILLPLP